MLSHPFPVLGNIYIGCDWEESWKDKCYDEDKSLVSTVECICGLVATGMGFAWSFSMLSEPPYVRWHESTQKR